MKPIYTPKGAAKEYGDFAINIYTGCPHRCFYCYSPSVLHIEKEQFHNHVEPRRNIVNAVAEQIEREQITDKLIHLCFTCDPYPLGYDSSPTREIIKLLKDSGNHVQILTKNGKDAMRDFDLLDRGDWFGVTYTGDRVNPQLSPAGEPNAGTVLERMNALVNAKFRVINTWLSCEPVLYPDGIFRIIKKGIYIDLFKFGKLNYFPIDIDWKEFGNAAESLCKQYNRNYYIKDGLRKEMEK